MNKNHIKFGDHIELERPELMKQKLSDNETIWKAVGRLLLNGLVLDSRGMRSLYFRLVLMAATG